MLRRLAAQHGKKRPIHQDRTREKRKALKTGIGPGQFCETKPISRLPPTRSLKEGSFEQSAVRKLMNHSWKTAAPNAQPGGASKGLPKKEKQRGSTRDEGVGRPKPSKFLLANKKRICYGIGGSRTAAGEWKFCLYTGEKRNGNWRHHDDFSGIASQQHAGRKRSQYSKSATRLHSRIGRKADTTTREVQPVARHGGLQTRHRAGKVHPGCTNQQGESADCSLK